MHITVVHGGQWESGEREGEAVFSTTIVIVIGFHEKVSFFAYSWQLLGLAVHFLRSFSFVCVRLRSREAYQSDRNRGEASSPDYVQIYAKSSAVSPSVGRKCTRR